jgi:prepilin-type N-terminal cleavage/methylation domain-containing protein
MRSSTIQRCERGSKRGFTLVELMVAMVGGLFVSIAVFSLAKHASGFAMRQSRIADATLQNVVGFERLKADIARAGFLSSPNLVRDRSVCRDPGDATYPARLARLASVFIQPVAPVELSTEMTLNGLAPSSIQLSGSYSANDQFVARNIVQGSPSQVFLAPFSLGMANIGYPTTPTAATLERVFAAGRALRVVDDEGHVQFAAITGVTGGTNPAIQLGASPDLKFRSGSNVRCGISGHGKNSVNVVNLIRYDLRDLNVSTQPGFRPMFRGGPTYEATRRELVREELDLTNGVIAGSLELIAEYAVDLGFSLLVAPNTTSRLLRVTGNDVITYAGDPTTMLAGNGPQLIRAVNAWLSVRSQEADRTTPLGLTVTGSGPNLLRISLNPTNRTLPPFARVRTLQSTIPLPNQARATWQ